MTAPVIYNGIEGPAAAEPPTYDGRRPLRVVMLGRVNRIKGQEVLLEAIASLPAELRARLAVRIVGSAFENPGREAALRAMAGALGVTATVSIEPFVADTAPLYRWADIVAVPSRRPESLGRVAIEAMSYGRPALVSAIGGLAEVVVDGVTGWLVPPGRADALALALGRIIEDPAAWSGFAQAARRRYCEVFSDAAVATAIAAAVVAA
jgi:glycosyltransferase involved in cell wall biosynthesis